MVMAYVLVTLQIASSIAIPCLLYALEVIPFTKSFLSSFEHPWTRIFMKVFNTFDSESISGCQYLFATVALGQNAQS